MSDVKKSLDDVFTKGLPTKSSRSSRYGKGKVDFVLNGLTKNS